MEISLEKIDIIKERTGVSYKEAKDALTEANGDLVEALIKLEATKDSSKWKDTVSNKSNEVMDKLKSIINSGNISRIIVKKDDYVVLDMPVTAGAIGALIIPQITAVAAAIALMSKCTIEVERPNKELVIINDLLSNTADEIVEKLKKTKDDFVEMTKKHTDNE